MFYNFQNYITKLFHFYLFISIIVYYINANIFIDIQIQCHNPSAFDSITRLFPIYIFQPFV